MNPPSRVQVLRGVEEFLSKHEVSFASLVVDALRDPKSPLAGDLSLRITDVLEALRPNLNTGPIIELGRFFASIASSELSKLEKHELWRLPATTLSADELEAFSVAEMSRQIASLAPGFSSFLHSVCVGKKVVDDVVVGEEDEADAKLGARRSMDPAQLLAIVRPPKTLLQYLFNSR